MSLKGGFWADDGRSVYLSLKSEYFRGRGTKNAVEIGEGFEFMEKGDGEVLVGCNERMAGV